MNQLIAVSTSTVGNDTIQTVNARDLHAFLGVRKEFSPWIKTQIERVRLVEGRDYVVTLPDLEGRQKGSGGHNKTDYHVTLRAAQHIAMMSGADKGFEVRDYFIECERRASDPEAMARAYIAKLQEQKRIGEAAARKLAELEAPVVERMSDAEFEKYVAAKLGELAPNGYSEIRIDVPSGHRSGEIIRIAGRIMTNAGRHPRFTPYGDIYLIVESLG